MRIHKLDTGALRDEPLGLSHYVIVNVKLWLCSQKSSQHSHTSATTALDFKIIWLFVSVQVFGLAKG